MWPWSTGRRPTTRLSSTNGSTSNTQIYYAGNYQYVNGDDYDFGNHEGRPVILENERYTGGLTVSDVKHTSRVTTVEITLKTPVEVEQGLAHGRRFAVPRRCRRPRGRSGGGAKRRLGP